MRFLGVSILYLFTAAVVTLLYLTWSTTERHAPPYNYSSIVAIASGQSPHPFNKRRLLVDSALLISRAVPESLWNRISTQIDEQPQLHRFFRQHLAWPREHDGLLISAALLIWLAVAGFMASCRWLVLILYETTPPIATLLGWVLGVALLGGGGPGHYQWYPYDFPQAFIFTLTLCLMLRGNPLLIVSFALAAYSKETAVLLIPAYVMCVRAWKPLRDVAILAALVAIFLAVRWWISTRFDPTGPTFWSPRRNSFELAKWLIYDHWALPLLAIAAACIVRRWPDLPVVLRRLTFLIGFVLVLSFFKGWIEERRQYSELLPIGGLIVIQVLLSELGLARHLRSKTTGKTLGVGWDENQNPEESQRNTDLR